MPGINRQWSFLLLLGYAVLMVVLFVLGIWHDGTARTLALYRAWPAAVEWLTHGRFTLEMPEAVAAAVLLLVLTRHVRLDLLTIRPGPVEVRLLEDASDGSSNLKPETLHRLNVEFREALAASQLYETTTIPGDLETERIIEVLRGGQAGDRLAMLGTALTFFWPRRAVVVTATFAHSRSRAQIRGSGGCPASPLRSCRTGNAMVRRFRTRTPTRGVRSDSAHPSADPRLREAALGAVAQASRCRWS